ncbi:MAG: pyridoxal-phosphate dependent enzyme, partial [Chitinophagaceae bacterium]
KYSQLLPFIEDRYKTTLGEGNTPLLRSKQLGAMLGLENLYFKLEMLNPSGSYKDRFAASAVSELLRQNQSYCLATSSGNTGAALAAYCAAVNISCLIAIVDGAPSGKIQQMQVYGAETMMVKDFGIIPEVSRNVFSGLQSMAKKYGSGIQISAYRYSPFGMAGVQTIAYEIAESLPDETCHIFSPAGGGGLTLAITKGFITWQQNNHGYKIPKVHCVQPMGNDTISSPLADGSLIAQAVSQSTTSISGLQVPNIIDGTEVIEACRATHGTGFAVTDELIYECQKNMAIKEGVYCEPAGAVALAGVIKALERNQINASDHVVCLVTGHGFKDPSSAVKIIANNAGRYYNNAKETLHYIETQLSHSNM